MDYINLGCGSRYHKDWVNLDMTQVNPYVKSYDLRRGIPYPDHSFELVYHSHLLEHFSRDEAYRFLKECWRVLRVGGVIRVVVPNLEEITRLYLQALDGSLQGKVNWQNRYEWMVLELYDQAVRERPGGAMLEYLRQPSCPDEAFIRQRLGVEAERMLGHEPSAGSINRLRSWNQPGKLMTMLDHISGLFRFNLLRLFLGSHNMSALMLGRFRLSGEVHQWMYDRYSLEQLLILAGFQNPKQQTPTISLIPSWADFHLDTEPDGRIYKPDSLYMEAIRPA